MAEMYESSAMAHIVETQWKKWLQLTQQKPGKAPEPYPTVTISRERGSGGSSIAGLVADHLGFVLFDSQIVDHVARSANVDRAVVEHMDEQSRHRIEEWTQRVLRHRKFSTQVYLSHLAKTISAVGDKGQAVVIGRGAHLLLSVERCFRVRVIAPLEIRIQRLSAKSSIGILEAETIIAETDRQRAKFIQENFGQSDSDPLLFDLVINTGQIALETAGELVVRAVEAKFPQVIQARSATHRTQPRSGPEF